MISGSVCLSWLISLAIIEFLMIVMLISKQHHPQKGLDQLHSNSKIHELSKRTTPLEWQQKISSEDTPSKKVIGGVAATLMLHSPTWFQRRYTLMIQNAANNIPDDWVVQIFYTRTGQSQKGLDINPGIQRYIDSGKAVLTYIPPEILASKRKRFELMFEPWLWENMLADTILMFGGTSVICSNSPYSVKNFTQFDYIGSPWGFKKGRGGEGGISIRSKRAMIAALNYKLDQVEDEEKKEEAFRSWGYEDEFYVKTLLEMEEAGQYPSKVAMKEDTERFAAAGKTVNDRVWAVSGTLPELPYEVREKFMSLCPEMKIFYPALHEPACFGAHPDGEACGKSICALKDKSERKGGC